MSDALSWLEKADSSISACSKLLEIEKLDIGAYLAQQAAEKTIKALLVHLGVRFRKTHDLGQLAQQIPSSHSLQANAASLSVLTTWATEYRYPSDANIPTPEPDAATIRRYLEQIGRLQESIVTLLPKPSSTLVRGLLARRPARAEHRNEVFIKVSAESLDWALNKPACNEPTVEAIRALMPAARLRGYKMVGGKPVKTGEIHVEEWAARDLLKSLTAGPKIYAYGLLGLNAMMADDIVKQRRELAQAFDEILTVTVSLPKPVRESSMPTNGLDTSGPEI